MTNKTSPNSEQNEELVAKKPTPQKPRVKKATSKVAPKEEAKKPISKLNIAIYFFCFLVFLIYIFKNQVGS